MTPDSTAGAGARDGRGRFVPGASGNPGGRRPTLAASIRARTRDGAALVRFLLGVMRDDGQAVRDRIKAAEVLLAYGFARPLPDELEGIGPGGVSLLSLEAARRIIAESNAPRAAAWGDALGSH
jgi:hypothetical protein